MKKSNKILIGGLIPFVLIFVFFYPRFLIQWLGEANPWTSYLYQYTFGLLFFGIGMLLILRTRACIPGRGRDSLWLKILVGGFVFFAAFHAWWVYMSIHWPIKG